MHQLRALPARVQRCRRKFLRHFPGGFHDETYLDGERDYKVETHARCGRIRLE